MANDSLHLIDDDSIMAVSPTAITTAPIQHIKRRKKYTKASTEENLQKFSEYFTNENGVACCKIVDCKAKLSRWTNYSLKRHLQQKHTSIYAKVFPDEASDEIGRRVIEFKTIQNAVSLLTKHGLPFLLLEKKPFQDLIKAGLDKLAAYGHIVTINRPVIAHEIALTSAIIQDRIKSELKGRMFSIMFDIATKWTIGMLGLDASFMLNDAVVSRSLGVIEIKERHTGAHIGEMIQDILKKYDLTLSQVYAATTDNGSNMLSSTRALNETANFDGISDESFYEQTDSDDDEMVHSNNNTAHNNTNNNAERYIEIINELTQNYTLQNDFLAQIPEIRCCAHSLQLAVSEALSKSNVWKNLISRIRSMCKALRNQVVSIEFKKLSPKSIIPPLDCPTRWSSVYIMVIFL